MMVMDTLLIDIEDLIDFLVPVEELLDSGSSGGA
jgi:hypothetical protein